MPTPPIQSSDTLYLEKLEFRPELRKTWLNFFVSNFRVVMLLIILITTWGVMSFNKLPRESNPEVKIGIVYVATFYPGASPADVEELVTKKLETGIAGLKGLKKLSSTSANSFSAITVEFESKEDINDAIRKLRDQVKTSQKDLPAEAQEPIVKEISFDDTPIWSISLTGPYDGFTMRKFGEDIKDELEKIPNVREVQISGGDEKEFEIAYDPNKLVSYGVSADQANQLVKATNMAIPAGSFEGQTYTYAVRSDSRFFTADALKNVPLFHTDDNGVVYLKDVARVSEKAIKRTIYSRLSVAGSLPSDAITLQIIKKTGGSIIDTVKEGKATVERMLASFPKGLAYETTQDTSKRIEKDFEQLTHDFTLTILLVSGILFLIVGLKEALVAGLAVPLTFFATFGVMSMTGITLNFLSIFSLLLALGLLVDDAIVVVSATKQYLKTGKFTPEEAVLLVLNDFKVVLTTTTLTTVWAFLPLLMSTGIIGEFIKSIPITVSVVLIGSLLIALMVNHPLAAFLERIRLTKKFFLVLVLSTALIGTMLFQQGGFFNIVLALALLALILWLSKWYFTGGNKKLVINQEKMDKEWGSEELIKQKLREQYSHEDKTFVDKLLHGLIHFDAVIPIYEKYVRKLVENTKVRFTVLGTVAILFIGAIALPATGIVPTEFFPVSNADLLFINIKASIGLNLKETDTIVQQVEKLLTDTKRYPEIVNFSTIVGKAGVSSGRTNTISNTTSHLAGITVNLIEKKERKIASFDIAKRMREDFKQIKEADIVIESQSSGPPSGSAFEARITGEDLQVLDKIARDLKPYVASIPGILDPDISLKESPAEYTFSLDPVKMELYSLNSATVGSLLRMAIAGTEVTKVILDGKEVKVMARFDEQQIPRLEDIQNVQILNTKRQPVFLKDVLKTELKPSVNSITRVDQKKTVLLSANVDASARPNAVVAAFQKKVKEEYRMPEGYTIKYGGENEQNNESVASILSAMQIAGMLIISTLIIQFNSFKKALIVLVTIPLALIGVFFGLAAFSIPLSFPGLIGVLALFGIVVKNAIILIDKINLNLKAGIPYQEAIIDAGKSRLEAIFITSICTIAGLIPVTLSDPTWMALGSAVIFGLALSSFLTLFIVPALFRTFVGEKERF